MIFPIPRIPFGQFDFVKTIKLISMGLFLKSLFLDLVESSN